MIQPMQCARIVACALALAAGGATAAFPDKPIRMVVISAPGGTTDIMSRLLAQAMGEGLGQQVVIDNRPGGGGIISAEIVSQSVPDGHTVLLTSASFAVNPSTQRKLPFDVRRDFIPVAFIARSPFGVMVRGDSPIESIQALISRSRANPGKLTLANEGPRTFGGIIARLVNARASMQANLVGYASVRAAVQDVAGGHADAVVADLASTVPLIRDGRLRLLAVTSGSREAG